jgi:imidazolonepropionase-like amidohydrolase
LFRLDDVGLVEAGQVADLLVVEGDPLESIVALRDPVQVLRAGRPVLAWPVAVTAAG